MSVKELLKEIRKNNIDLRLSGESLRVGSDSNMIPEGILNLIRENKQVIIEYLKEKTVKAEKETGIKPTESPDGCYPLSTPQRRLWVLSQFAEASVAYNIPAVYVFEGTLDITALSASFSALIERHQSLRTVFRETVTDDIVQYIKSTEETAFTLSCTDLRQHENIASVAEELIQAELAMPFDLVNGPLIRASLYQLSNSKWILCCAMHHIISDGWSMGILIKELLLFYQSFSTGTGNLPAPLKLQYKDYASWQQS
ncbi:MAG: condensation domain-containing protein, partial [Bacteroidetes bacterium]|nr:condensation domain-containing protein [Bacteroidota bacterium]